MLTDTLTARADSGVTRALGIAPLKEEESLNFGLGFTAQLAVAPRTPSVPPNISRFGSVRLTDCPFVVNQFTLRQTKSPPSVTMKDGIR